MIRIAAVAILAVILANPLFAEQIERACLKSDRGQGNRSLCGCIQDAANLTLTSVVLPIFIVQGKVEWIPAVILAIGLTAGGWIGAHAAVRGGERFIRAVMVVASIALAAKLLGAFG